MEDSAICSGTATDSQAGVVVPANQSLRFHFVTRTRAQTGAAGAQLPQDKLTDAEVKAQDNNVDTVDQKQTGGLVPARKT